MLVTLALSLSVGATPAAAIVAKIGGHGYGITPIKSADEASLVAAYRAEESAARPSSRARAFDEPPHGGRPLEFEGGPVMHSVTTHVVYWDPPPSQFTATTKAIIGNFFTDVAHDSGLPSNVFPIAGQYTDATGNAAYSSTFAGALVDSHTYPTSGNCTVPDEVDKGPYSTCLFDEQIQNELSAFINESGLPRGPTQLYFVLLPHSVVSCVETAVCSNNFYCAYHSYISPGTANEIIYADIPFSLLDPSFAKDCQSDGNAAIQLPNGDKTSNTETRFADVALKYISHEYIEAVTDPLAGNKTAWVDKEGQEIGDKCDSVPLGLAEEGEPGFDKHAFTPTLGGVAASGTLFNQSINAGEFYLQSEWDNAGKACLMKPVELSNAAFAGTTSAVPSSPVGFHGSATDPYGQLELNWTFGDGATGVSSSPTHTYAAVGEYSVTMTPKDNLTGSTGPAVSHTVTVAQVPAPPPPAPASLPTTTTAVVVAPDSSFPTAHAAINAKTGVLTFTTSVADPGTFSWILTFQNGRFGVFAASRSNCKRGQVQLNGKCRSWAIVFGRGRAIVTSPGTVTFTVKPSTSGLKALRNALKQKKGLPVTVTLTFQSSHGAGPTSHTQSLNIRLKKK
jgi:hypothetical protein